jgi:hypothetical protein
VSLIPPDVCFGSWLCKNASAEALTPDDPVRGGRLK